MKASLKILILAVAGVSAWYLSVFAAEGFSGEKITEGTEITEITEYKQCGHTEKTEYSAAKSLAGLNPGKAAEKLGCKFKSYENKSLTITKTVDGLCAEHSTVKLDDGNTITVYSAKDGSKKASYAVSPSQFSKSDLERLKDGITVNSAAELSAVIEDYTS